MATQTGKYHAAFLLEMVKNHVARACKDPELRDRLAEAFDKQRLGQSEVTPPAQRCAFALLGEARALCRLVLETSAGHHDMSRIARPLADSIDHLFNLTGTTPGETDDDDQGTEGRDDSGGPPVREPGR